MAYLIACSGRIRETDGGITFLPADCKTRYVTTQHLVEVGGKREKIEIIFSTAPLPSSISVDISECFISCQNAV